jgi:hypothetical protein
MLSGSEASNLAMPGKGCPGCFAALSMTGGADIWRHYVF